MRRLAVRLYEWLDLGPFISGGVFDYDEWHAFLCGFFWAFSFGIGKPYYEIHECQIEPWYAKWGVATGFWARVILLGLIILGGLFVALSIFTFFTEVVTGCPVSP